MPVPAKVGTIIDIPVSQQVGPDAADEFQLLLHTPNRSSLTVNVYRVDVSLLYDNVSTPVDAGNVILSLPFDPNFQYVWTRSFQATRGKNIEFMGNEFPEISRCLIGNAKRLGALLSLPGQRSSALTSLRSSMAYCCALNLPAVQVVRCSGQKPSVRPSSILVGCDGSSELQQINWSEWNFTNANGTAILRTNSCEPSCADGTSQAYPVKIRFSQPIFMSVSGYSGWVWNNAVVTFTGSLPSGSGRNVTYENFAPSR
jgi:hypothetical protein